MKILSVLIILLTGCVSGTHGRYDSTTGKLIEQISFFEVGKKGEASNIALSIEDKQYKHTLGVGSIKSAGDAELLREIRGLLQDVNALKSP